MIVLRLLPAAILMMWPLYVQMIVGLCIIKKQEIDGYIILLVFIASSVSLTSSEGLVSSGNTAGRLMIQINEISGTVCSSGFDINEADIACRRADHHLFTGAVSFTTAGNLG